MEAQTPATKKQRKRRAVSPTSRLISARQASIEIGIAYTSLRDAVHRGEVAVVRFGRSWFFERRDLDAWITSRKERVGA